MLIGRDLRSRSIQKKETLKGSRRVKSRDTRAQKWDILVDLNIKKLLAPIPLNGVYEVSRG